VKVESGSAPGNFAHELETKGVTLTAWRKGVILNGLCENDWNGRAILRVHTLPSLYYWYNIPRANKRQEISGV
jgi:hypothetical protein